VKKLPTQYVLNKFYAHAGEPIHNKYNNIYNGSCCVCREGKSWLKKKRLYFYPDTNSFYCFNCNKSWNAYNWISQVTGLSKDEIQAEAFVGEVSKDVTNKITKERTKRNPNKQTLPMDSINVEDNQQHDFYKHNSFYEKALDYISLRKLNTAVNRSPNYYISLTDYIHKNRLCIPYYDVSGKIVFYQTRSLDNSEPRYLNKIGCDKTIFGIERIDPDIPYIFLFEGPIDAMFVKNGVALAGLTLSNHQQTQLNSFIFHEKIWVLDNPKKDEASKESIFKLLQRKERVFKWPDNKPYKDFNEWAVKENLTEISPDEITKSLYF
jgi:DNA primase